MWVVLCCYFIVISNGWPSQTLHENKLRKTLCNVSILCTLWSKKRGTTHMNFLKWPNRTRKEVKSCTFERNNKFCGFHLRGHSIYIWNECDRICNYLNLKLISSIASLHSKMIDWVYWRSSRGTFWKRAASGLNSGVSMNYRKRLDRRFLRPSKDVSFLPLLSMSASLSIKSTISLVKLQSNSLTVHLVWSRTSSLSSVDRNGNLKPLNKSINSFARVENGVCTSV